MESLCDKIIETYNRISGYKYTVLQWTTNTKDINWKYKIGLWPENVVQQIMK